MRQPARIPDYGFENGIPISVLDYSNEGVSSPTLKGQPNVGQDTERDALVAQQMFNTRRRRGLGGKFVEYAVIEPLKPVEPVEPEDAPKLMYALYGWGGMTRHPVAIGEAQALAAANPDSYIVLINTPGAGRSEALPPSVQKEIMRKGHYGLLGQHLAIATAKEREGKIVSLDGHSLGGRTAIGMVPFIAGGVDRLVVNDPTGAKRISLGSVVMNFAYREKRHLDRYVSAGFDPAASERQHAPVSKAIRETSEKVRGGLYQMLIVDPVGLTRGGLENDLKDALPNVNTLTRVLSPELSEINDWRYVAEVLAKVAKYKKEGAILEQWVLEGHTHGFMAAAPGVEAFLYSAPSVREKINIR